MSISDPTYDPNHKYKFVVVRNNLTSHLKNPINVAYIDLIRNIEGYNSISEWIAHVIEDEMLPERISNLSKKSKEN